MSQLRKHSMPVPTPRGTRFLLALTLLVLIVSPTQANQVYKHTAPDGRIIYTDTPPKGTNNWQTVDVPKPPTEAERARAQKRAQDEARKREEFRNRADTRRKRLEDADDKLASARKAVEDAEKALESGRTPQAGDRMGVAGPGSRLSEDYFRRVAELEGKVEAAKKDLASAQRERNDAR